MKPTTPTLAEMRDILCLLIRQYHGPLCSTCGEQWGMWYIQDGRLCLCDRCLCGRYGREDTRAPVMRKLLAFLEVYEAR